MIETVRCFVACDLTMEVLEALTDAQRALRDALGDGPRVRWVNPATLHLTLKFLGDKVDRGVTTAVGDALTGACRPLPPFDLRLAGLGAFPSPARARVLWAGVEDPSGGLATAWAGVEDAMAELGFDRQPRGLSAHVTLGRVRDKGKVDLAELLKPWTSSAFGVCPVDEVVLYRSLLTPRGPNYEPMIRAPLRGTTLPAQSPEETT